ncbi:rhomboid family intramembrane serine protease [Hymenobacter sp. 15J16-1T3B]|uniref:rhomboid family intramembrane serine protease n=1 Tax=Hymenobacter sp. 15J16-1T3B TaxID=2886941 RepID=UPI001D126397|nr:rhomboid family intramembrane serine protease [Hymenobacter sp. 15J16-1T3B]MCC3158284.1 rhomboid family intramembrane serine protease [Hymenobacter sp. 15J16-1T3B]
MASEENASAYSLALPIEPLAPPQALMLADETARRLGWAVFHLSSFGLRARRAGARPAGADVQLTVLLYANAVEVSSGPADGAPPEPADDYRQPIEAFARAFAAELPAADAAALQCRFEQARPAFVPPSRDVLAPPAERRTFLDWLGLLRPRRGYVVTPVLIVACLLVFVLMAVNGANLMLPAGEDLLRWGADYGPLTLGEGQWWRLLSSAFVHIGIIHLLLNMYALLNIGLLLEPRIGPVRFGLAYLLAAVGGGLASLWWHDYTVSAGASGAIFGMYGVFLALLTTNVVEAEVRKELLGSITAFVGYNLLFGLAGNIDNAAHLGGLLTGLLVGYGLWPTLRPGVPALRQHLLTTALALALLAGAGWAYGRLPNAWATYQALMQEFSKQEVLALNALNQPPGTPRDEQLRALQEHGIYYWEQNLRLLQRLDSLRLPDEAEERNAAVTRYTRLRLRSYQLRYRALAENSAAYADSIRAYDQQIEALIEAQKPKPE